MLASQLSLSSEDDEEGEDEKTSMDIRTSSKGKVLREIVRKVREARVKEMPLVALLAADSRDAQVEASAVLQAMSRQSDVP